MKKKLLIGFGALFILSGIIHIPKDISVGLLTVLIGVLLIFWGLKVKVNQKSESHQGKNISIKQQNNKSNSKFISKINNSESVPFKTNRADKECDYIILDLETSSLDVHSCDILEVGAIKIKDDKIVDSFSSLVRPVSDISQEALNVNKLDLSELETAPTDDVVLPDFFEFLGNNELKGYNIDRFDLPILKRYAVKYNYPLDNMVDDVLLLARQKLHFLPNKKLSTVASYLQIDSSKAHRAIEDCEITLNAYLKILTHPDIERTYKTRKYNTKFRDENNQLNELNALLMGITADGELNEDEALFLNKWLKDHDELKGNYPYDRIFLALANALEDGILEKHEIDELLKLFNDFVEGKITSEVVDKISIDGKAFVLTGDFSRGSRNKVTEEIEALGGIPRSGVSGKTDYVIVGDLGSGDWISGHYGTKIKKAKELQSQGKNITIISESDFFANL